MFKKIGDKINIGIKCITLLYRELIVNRTDSSKDFSTELINNVLKFIELYIILRQIYYMKIFFINMFL